MATVACPTCGDRVVWGPASLFRPFCSERCKNVDLGAWASERYAIGGEADGDGEPGEAHRRSDVDDEG